MAKRNDPCPSITIASGAQNSPWVVAERVYDDADQITLYAPAALEAATYTIELARDIPTDKDDVLASATAYTLSDGAADIAPPAAGKARTYNPLNGMAFRIHCATIAAATRIFLMSKSSKIY